MPDRQTKPWLGRVGLAVTGVLYVLGAGLVFLGNYAEEHFLASPGQLAGIGAGMVARVVIAFSIRSLRLPRTVGNAPSPWVVGAAALGLTSAYWGPAVLVTVGWYEWIGVAAWFTVVALGVMLVSRWSRQQGWNQRHRLALAAGATLTYAWAAFPVPPEGGGSLAIDLVSNTVFGVVAIIVLVLAARVTAAHVVPKSADARALSR